jgi:anti-anti-sigma factor
MEILTRTEGDCTTLDIGGRLDALSAPEAQVVFNRAIETGATRLVVNLAGVEYVSSAGLRVLLATAKQLSRRGGKMVLCELQSGVRDVLRISGLLFILSVAEDETTAQSLATA